MKKLILIHPPTDDEYKDITIAYETYPPPVGLLVLNAFVKKNYPEIKVEIYDGPKTSFDEISNNLHANFFGFSDWFTNHKNGIALARIAKEKNPDSKIIFGGPNASNLGTRLLNNRTFIDFVVYGDGEESLLGIVQEDSVESIPNLWFRDNVNSSKFTFYKPFNLSASEIFDLESIYKFKIDNYFPSALNNGRTDNIMPLPLSSIRGCIKAFHEGRCYFCCVPFADRISLMPPKIFWKQIELITTKYNIRKFFETGDNFIIGSYPKKLLKAKPKDLSIQLRIYANPNSITEENVSILKDIGIDEVFLGIESSSEDLLKSMNKKQDLKKTENSLKLLSDNNINVFAAFILGLLGETENTLSENYKFMQYLTDKYPNIHRLLLTPGIPLIGTKWFQKIQNNNTAISLYNEGGKYSLERDDDINYQKLIFISLRILTSVSSYSIFKILNSDLSRKFKGRIASFINLDESMIEKYFEEKF